MGKEGVDSALDQKKFSKEEKDKIKKKNRKLRQKINKKLKKNPNAINDHSGNDSQKPNISEEKNNVEIEYVERDEYLLTGKYYEEFKNVFQYFATQKIEKGASKNDYDDSYSNDQNYPGGRYDENEQKDKLQSKELKLSRKKRKQLKMLKVAQLKALVKRPDVVEVNTNIFIH